MNMQTEIHKLLTPYHLAPKIRLGANHDGGYILSSQHLTEYLISCGCADNTTFEQDYINKVPNAHIEIYDGTSKCSWTHQNAHFNNRNVYKLSDLSIKDDCVVKMDIEGSELPIFHNIDDHMNKITQLVFEIHMSKVGSLDQWVTLFKNINKTHTLFHIHGNNHEYGMRYGVPDVLELSYIRNDLMSHKTVETNTFPIHGLDFANCTTRPDLFLNWWIK